MGAESETRGAENRREQEVEVLANFRRYSNNLPLMSYTCSRRAHFVFAFGAYLVQFDDGTGPGRGVGDLGCTPGTSALRSLFCLCLHYFITYRRFSFISLNSLSPIGHFPAYEFYSCVVHFDPVLGCGASA